MLVRCLQVRRPPAYTQVELGGVLYQFLPLDAQRWETSPHVCQVDDPAHVKLFVDSGYVVVEQGAESAVVVAPQGDQKPPPQPSQAKQDAAATLPVIAELRVPDGYPSNVNDMDAEQLRIYGKQLGLTFPSRTPVDKMRAAIATAQEQIIEAMHASTPREPSQESPTVPGQQ